jgi:hypothetical protein
MKIRVVELFDPLGIEYCTFWFCSVVEKSSTSIYLLQSVTYIRKTYRTGSGLAMVRLARSPETRNRRLIITVTIKGKFVFNT